MAQESRDTGSKHDTGSTLPDVTGDAATLTKNFLRVFSICAIAASGLYIIASFFPDSFLWGVNHLAFVGQWERIIIIVLIVFLGLPVLSSRYLSIVEHRGLGSGLSPRQAIPIIAVFAAVATLIFYSNPLATDLYGDTRTLISLLMEQKYSWIDILSLSDREPLTRFIHQFLGDSFYIEYTTIYEIISAVCGGCFVAATLVFARSFRDGGMWKLLILIFFLTSGAIQQFFCHIEDYTIIYVWLTIFFMVAWKFFDSRNMFVLMIIMFLVGTRLHAEMVLVSPAVIFAVVYHLQRKYSFSDKWLRPARIILFVGISLVFLAMLYFFYFHADHYDTGGQQEVLTKIFLPLTGYQPPPFHYSLFSLDHLSDVLQQILLTVSPAALVMLVIGFVFRKSIRWNEPYMIFLGLSIFYFLLFNLSFHPMLSMPRDWDLLSLASVPVTFLAVVVSRKIFERLPTSQIQKTVVGLSLALGLFSWTFICVNGSGDSASRRLEGVGRWVFRSYHAGSAYILNVSAKMIPDLNEQIARREQTIQKLLPYASATDFEINFLYHKLGVAQYAGRQFKNARISFTEALRRDPENASAIRMLGLIAMQTRNFEEASKIFSFYNKRINSPRIVDPRIPEFEYSCNQLKKLVSSGVDSTTIEHELDVIFQETK